MNRKLKTGIFTCTCVVSEAGWSVLQHTHRLLEPFIFASLNKHQQHLLTQFTSKAPLYFSEIFEHQFETIVKPPKIFSMYRNDGIQFTSTESTFDWGSHQKSGIKI